MNQTPRPPVPSWRHLTYAFNKTTLERALINASSDAVRDVRVWTDKQGTHLFEALVQSTEEKPYQVSMTLGEGDPPHFDIESICSCPAEHNCVHAATALIVHFNLSPANMSTPSTHMVSPHLGRKRATKKPTHVADALIETLSFLKTHHSTAPPEKKKTRPPLDTTPGIASYPARSTGLKTRPLAPAHTRATRAKPGTLEQRLVLRIHVDTQQQHPTVQLLYGNVRKDGSLSALQNANSDWGALLRNRPRYVTDEDVPLIRRLFLATNSQADARVLVRDSGVLRAFVEAGKAVVSRALTQPTQTPWPTTQAKTPEADDTAAFPRVGLTFSRSAAGGEDLVLHWGKARPASGSWRKDRRGKQHFVLDVTPAAQVFIVESLWYLDATNAEIGPITADLDPEIAAVLLKAPIAEDTIQPHDGNTPVEVLAQAAAPNEERPPPQTVQVRQIHAPGIVHLQLSNDPAVAGAMARVKVHYDNLAVSLTDQGEPRWFNDELVAPVLDETLHERTLNRIEAVGFQRAGDLAGETPHQTVFYLDANEVLPLIQSSVPYWRELGWVITIDPKFSWQLVDAGPISIDTELEADNHWFSLDLGVDVEGERISLLPVLTRVLNDRNLRRWLMDEAAPDELLSLRIDTRRLIRLPVARVRTILQTLLELSQVNPDKPVPIRLTRTDAARLKELVHSGVHWNAPDTLHKLANRLTSLSEIPEVPRPEGLHAELRPYQRSGLAWLQFLREYDLAGILADDMGLGKTVQTIAHILTEKNAGRLAQPALVIAPTSVVHNWQNEIARFAPDLKTLVLQGPARAEAFDHIKQVDVVLSTYPLLPRDIEALTQHHFHLAIFDEAQYLKNARTRAAIAASQLRVTHRIALTGTPLENNLGELWSLFHLLMPGFLSDSRRFTQLYRTPIEKHGDVQRRTHLARRIRPFVLRRTKDMVARELPAKTEIEHSIELQGAQRDLYETVRATMEKRVRDALANRGLAQSHIVVLDALLKLRQVCCDPRLVAAAAAQRVEDSAKLERLMELLPEMIVEGRRVLLFSQFTSMLDLIEPKLKEAGIDFVRLTGETKDRKTPIERFQNGEVPLFLISLKAGGTGLNLSSADTVIHYDPWWNPAVENQATDRAHRIGQDKPVFVHRLIAAGTVEERIRALQARKADLARGILNEDTAMAKVLTAEDFQALFEPLPEH